MGVTVDIPKRVMLAMVRAYYISQYAIFRTQELLSLDGVVYKLWHIDCKVYPKKWLSCDVVCFEAGRPKKQVSAALEAANRSYNLSEYEVWCLPETLSAASAVVRKLPLQIRKKTTIHDLGAVWNLQERSVLLVYAVETIAKETTDSDIYWETKESVNEYGSCFAIVFDSVNKRIEPVLRSLTSEGYSVEQMLRKETYTVYQIQKRVQGEPVKCDLKLAEIRNLNEEQLKELDSNMFNNFIVVDDTGATEEDREILIARIRCLLNEVSNETSEPNTFSQASPSKIDGRKSIALGLEYQRKVTSACKENGWTIKASFERGKPDILRLDEQHRVTMVIAVKSYSLEVITKGKSCHNCRGHKYVVSFMASRDAKAEVKAARENGLERIWLICGNLKTGNTIYSGYVGFDEKVGLKERQQD